MQWLSSSETLQQPPDDAETVPVGHEDSQQPLGDAHFQQILSSGLGETAGSYSLGSWAVLSQSQGVTPPPGGRVVPYPGDLGEEPTFSPSPTSRHRRPSRLHGCIPPSSCQGTVLDSAGHVIGSTPVQPLHGVHNGMKAVRDGSPGAMPQKLAQQLTGTADWSWRQYGNGEVHPSSGPKSDADGAATSPGVHALQSTLKEDSASTPAEEQHLNSSAKVRQIVQAEATMGIFACMVCLWPQHKNFQY